MTANLTKINRFIYINHPKMVVFAIINQSYSPETIVMVTDPAEVDHYKAEFMHGLDKTIFRENHPYKFYDRNGKPDWMKVAKILNRIADLKGIKVEAFASDNKLKIESRSWSTECTKLPLLLHWFKRFYRRHNKYKDFLGL